MSRPLEDYPRYPLWPIFGLVLLLLLAMGHVVTHEFSSWDDLHTLTENPAFNPPTWTKIARYWNPTSAAGSLWVPVTYTIWGVISMGSYLQVPDENNIRLNPFAFHAASLACHLISTLLVYGLLRRAFAVFELARNKLTDLPMAPAAAWVGAAIFAVHPLQVETVAWTSGLKDLLSCLFSLATVTCAANLLEQHTEQNNRPFRSRWFYLGFLFFLLGTLSKPTSMTAPALAVAYGWLALQRPLKEVLRTFWPWFLFVPVVMAWTKYHQQGGGVTTVSLPLRPLIALDALAFYMGKLLLPINLTFNYSRRPITVLSSGAIWWTWVFPAALALTVFLFRKRAGRPAAAPLAAGLLMALIAVAPVLGFSTFLYQYYTTTADHYCYPAMAGIALAAGWGYLQLRNLPARNVLVALLLVVLSAMSIVQMRIWTTSRDLYLHSLIVNPINFAATQNLGSMDIQEAGNADHAGNRELCQQLTYRALEWFNTTVALRPDFSPGWDSKATAHILLRDYAAGLAALEQAMAAADQTPREVRKSTLSSRILLARFLIERGLYDRAIQHLQKALLLADEENAPQSIKTNIQSLLSEAKSKRDNPTTTPTTIPTTTTSPTP